MALLLLLLLGFAAGMLSGLLGIGGGMIFTPVMFYMFNDQGVDDPVKWTIGTSLFCGFMSALSSAVTQLHKYRLFIKDALWLSAFGIFGTWLAQQVVNSGYYNKGPFAVLFSLVLFYTAYRFFANNQSSIEKKRALPRPKDLRIGDNALVGGTSGLVSSLVGIGGGIVVVPFLTLIYNQHIRKVVVTSTFVVVILALAGWVQFGLLPTATNGISRFTWGYVDFGASVPLVIGSFAGAVTGVRVAHRVNRMRLQQLFGVLAILLGLKLWWDFL
jgi:uncharacterized protein